MLLWSLQHHVQCKCAWLLHGFQKHAPLWLYLGWGVSLFRPSGSCSIEVFRKSVLLENEESLQGLYKYILLKKIKGTLESHWISMNKILKLNWLISLHYIDRSCIILNNTMETKIINPLRAGFKITQKI